MLLFFRKIIEIFNMKMLLKGREEAKKQANIFDHNIEGKMIKTKVIREVKFIYYVFFSDPSNHATFFKVLCVFVHAIYFFQPSGLNTRVISSEKCSLSLLSTPSRVWIFVHLCVIHIPATHQIVV